MHMGVWFKKTETRMSFGTLRLYGKIILRWVSKIKESKGTYGRSLL